jgi:hypothetical protein
LTSDDDADDPSLDEAADADAEETMATMLKAAVLYWDFNRFLCGYCKIYINYRQIARF